jgi:hypothetical protein
MANATLHKDTVTAYGENAIIGFPSATAAPVTAICQGIKPAPKLMLKKTCEAVIIQDSPFAHHVAINIAGYVSNAGDIDIDNVIVTDSDGYEWNIGYLAAGANAPFTRVVIPSDPTAAQYSDTVVASGDVILGFGITRSESVTAVCQGVKVRPGLILRKECEVITEELPSPYGYSAVRVLYRGSVSNIGNVPLLNVTVIDDNGTPSDHSDDVLYGPFNLLPSQAATFNGSYEPVDPTSPLHTDTVVATANNAVAGFPAISATPVQASCRGIRVNPKLTLRKSCEVKVQENKDMGQVFVFWTGSVTNDGDVSLSNVIVNELAENGTVLATFGPFFLRPHEIKQLSGSYPAANPTALIHRDSLNASADIAISGFGSILAEQVTAECLGLRFNPELAIYKNCEVKVEKVHKVIALKVNYSGYVENVGDVTLVNVFVRDDKGTPADLTDDDLLGPWSLAIGERKTFTGSYYPCIDVNELTKIEEIEFSDTVTATGEHYVMGFENPEMKSATAFCPICKESESQCVKS